ncbi:MliC family protein [Marinospirillum insulare]|uniref:C-type lysozyme inhibitor domain-containing protein n=1 Tax=Marinospirillum insulare TaxID=217169 RepID=A0ABQ5ZYF5_9GAMM|nr:MliC family protein [Marinospirillum insulare]GLR63382.1 hypothetical protein GCM10007878_08170 [Marinospirillum insulare]
MTLVSWIKASSNKTGWAKLARLACLLATGLLVACTSIPKLEQATQADFWLCEDGSLIETRLGKEQLWLQLPASTHWLALPQQRAASGARYSNNEGTSVWNKGHRSRIATPEITWQNCQRTASGKPGELEKPKLVAGTNTSPDAVVLKASGHNPGWTLEAKQNGQLVLLQNFGTQRITFKDSKVIEQDLIKTLSQAKDPDGNLLKYKVENILCIEINTGEPFPHRVEIHYLNKKMQGCGRSF